MKKININYPMKCLTLVLLLPVMMGGCKKLVEVNAPITSVNSGNVYTVDATAIAAVSGVYTKMSRTLFTNSVSGLSLYAGMSADEFTLYSGASNVIWSAFYQNKLTNVVPGSSDYFWNGFYAFIYDANAAIAGLNNSSTLTPAVSKELLGESYFIRAFCYFYLTNLYGDVPMPLTTDYKAGALLSRTAQKQVYQQIITDLLQAQALLPQNYVDGTVLKTILDRTRPNYWTATALLARTYLYTGSNADAVTQASAVIANSSLFSLSSLSNAFLMASKGNNEAIWQLQGTGNYSYNAQDALTFILPASGPTITYPFYLSQNLMQSFESGDGRLVNWTSSVTVSGTTYYYPYKYKVNSPTAPASEYEMIFRLAEQYLIRAEAEIGTNPLQSVADLNMIRKRAGLPNYSGATDAASLETAILHERRVELFSEWGHRWLDLKRTNTVNAVMGSPGNVCAQKGGSWSPNWALYPIPLTEIQHDPSLTQNPGY